VVCLLDTWFLPQTDLMTRAELAFSALDRIKTGFITQKELEKLSKKLSNQELMVLMKRVKVGVFIIMQ
jgi:Ca2+-binding EF-hand superfamily protein